HSIISRPRQHQHSRKRVGCQPLQSLYSTEVEVRIAILSSFMPPQSMLAALSFWVPIVLTLPLQTFAQGSSDSDSESRCNDVHTCRTLSSVIWSCVTTLLACVWTAIHRNIPGPNEGRVAKVLEMAKIFLVTLLVPEWTLIWAVRQYF